MTNFIPANTTVFILSGGQGKRLRPAYQAGPKPLAPINNEPFLFFLLNYLTSFSFNDFTLCLGYRSSEIKAAVAAWPNPNHVNLSLSTEDIPLGTAGALKKAQPFINSEFFIVINGDTFLNLDYHQYFNFFSSHCHRSVALLALTTNQDHRASGSITLNPESIITGFYEKSSSLTPRSYINAGIYLFHRSILDLIPQHTFVSLEYTVLPLLIKTFPRQVYGFPWTGDFIDIGTPRHYQKAQQLLKPYQHYHTPHAVN